MCGIAGFSRFQFEAGDESLLTSMGQAILHRGPDAGGTYIDEHVGLCHRRLSILDLSAAGNQPMFSKDQRYVIVFNGEIYNFLELRAALETEGHVFSTHTDTEVIIALYAKMGVECLAELNGMFTFAIWDKQEHTLFIARDRMGKKPLYYTYEQGKLAFASEIKALLPVPFVEREIRDDAVYDFFAYQYIPDPKTIFKGVHKCPPAHYMFYKNGELTCQQYWDVDFSKVSQASEEELTNQLRDLTAHCTRQRMIADVPLGAFLSGGVDSSGVVAMMAQQSESPVKTCSIGFDEKRFNETEFARIVAEQYHTEHHEFIVHDNVSDNLEHIVSFFDEPFADPSLVPTYFVSKLARQEVTVAIAGDGGDEVFAGYEKYSIDAIENDLRNKVPTWIRKAILPKVANLVAGSGISVLKKVKSLCDSLSCDPAMGFYITNSQIDDRQWQQLVKPDFAAKLGAYHPSKITLDAYEKANGPDHLSRILYTDMKTYLPGGILVKVDRMSMAHSLEVRAPILDRDVIEFAATVPSAFKFKNGEKKHILKEAFKPLLPNDILYRKKMGFSVPLDQWLRDEIKAIAEKYLFAEQAGLLTYFNASAIKQLWNQHQSGSHQHGTVLWSLLMFEMWYQRYMNNTGKAA
ncbi:asparagine synthase (glutamine-hydrolyzing) [Aestuariibacter sp. GS-14]|uniref:asparagine synthase (glutamine-hydrolyzing) n=1 Tax=Aestuariibacter sp. GS-14 TaxID=2590670 RepID=UPI00112E9796|nr:asparagine synthase (glutamine-hydrolyzing) [Aestuariibacter sp. GS-14]TPV62104.1 asparagine synthase (glutamine-hydrolyzing) [Aestuariibacter sp. GS-14]